MRTREDIESYLMRSNLSYKALDGEDMWLLRELNHEENIILSVHEGLVLFRVKVVDLERITQRDALAHKLLELNASDLVHSAYGISDGAIVLTANMALENLDYNEFQATVDDLSLALSSHHEIIRGFTESGAAA